MKSIKAASTAECVNCKESFDVDNWSLIDAVDSPELQEAALCGELNLVLCPHCASMFYYDTDFLYVDYRTGLLAFVFSEKNRENADKLKKKMKGDFELIKDMFSKERNLPSEPVYIFGLEELQYLLREEEQLLRESEVVAGSSAVNGFKLASLKPAYSKKYGYPLYVPVKSDFSVKDYATSAAVLLEGGLCSGRLKKFADDMSLPGAQTPEIL
ncbi:CpXC protein [Parelusimicrobium proximum]|uniref:CpXC domain-containing protein n=1 Tax=Parelusimicrobium proximum TaxID=3228953 RepID=UPI003D17E323